MMILAVLAAFIIFEMMKVSAKLLFCYFYSTSFSTFNHRTSTLKEEKQEIPKLIRDKIEKELNAWTGGNKKDVVYQLGHNLFFSKDSVVRAEAWREPNRLIDYYEDPKQSLKGEEKSFQIIVSNCSLAIKQLYNNDVMGRCETFRQLFHIS